MTQHLMEHFPYLPQRTLFLPLPKEAFNGGHVPTLLAELLGMPQLPKWLITTRDLENPAGDAKAPQELSMRIRVLGVMGSDGIYRSCTSIKTLTAPYVELNLHSFQLVLSQQVTPGSIWVGMRETTPPEEDEAT